MAALLLVFLKNILRIFCAVGPVLSVDFELLPCSGAFFVGRRWVLPLGTRCFLCIFPGDYRARFVRDFIRFFRGKRHRCRSLQPASEEAPAANSVHPRFRLPKLIEGRHGSARFMTDEARRLEVLLEYGQLDTPPEPALDELTELAADVCETPISMISLVDDHRQWFKSKKGVDNSETERKHSFCAHALYDPGLLIVPDATADDRFANYPTVTGDPHMRFYAGAPLLTPDGMALGTLCVIDRVNRHLSDIQKRTLRVLSRQVMARFELQRQARALLESETLLSKMFRSCPVAVTLKSWRDEVFLHVNQAFTTLVGWPREELMGRTMEDLGLLEAAEVENRPENVILVRRRSGETRRVLMDSTVILDAREPQVITTFVDITELEKAEAKLQLSGERIERLHTLAYPLAKRSI